MVSSLRELRIGQSFLHTVQRGPSAHSEFATCEFLPLSLYNRISYPFIPYYNPIHTCSSVERQSARIMLSSNRSCPKGLFKSMKDGPNLHSSKFDLAFRLGTAPTL